MTLRQFCIEGAAVFAGAFTYITFLCWIRPMTDMTEADRKAFSEWYESRPASLTSKARAYSAWQAALLYARIKGGSSERHARHHAIALEQCAVFIADGIDNCSKAISRAMAEAADFLRSAYSPPAESEELARLRAENEQLIDENCDLKTQPWPEWAEKALKIVRSYSGNDGFGDVFDGVDLPEEIEECLSELEAEINRLNALAASPAPVDDGNIKFVPIDANTGRRTVKVPEGQTPLDDSLHHPILDVFNEGIKARDSGEVSPYHGHSLEHCIHSAGWVQRDLRIALDKAHTSAGKLTP